MTEASMSRSGLPGEYDQLLDASSLICPMPLLKTKLALNTLPAGSVLLVLATDAGSSRDIPAFLKYTDHTLLSVEEVDGQFRFLIKKTGSRVAP